ncbi:hypothetical protein AAY473_040747 [Plecturocebus cupreus]
MRTSEEGSSGVTPVLRGCKFPAPDLARDAGFRCSYLGGLTETIRGAPLSTFLPHKFCTLPAGTQRRKTVIAMEEKTGIITFDLTTKRTGRPGTVSPSGHTCSSSAFMVPTATISDHETAINNFWVVCVVLLYCTWSDFDSLAH